MTRTWFITGGSKGIGFETAKIVLENGDQVISFSRTEGKLASLKEKYDQSLLICLGDIEQREAVFAAAAKGAETFKGIDIALSNAGMMLGGMVEETTEAEARKIMNVNFFGSLWTAQVVSPYLRKKQGRFIQMSSIGGIMSWMTSGLYSASKFAIEGLTEALAQELAPFGVHVTIVEPGGYWTDLYKNLHSSERFSDYQELHQQMDDFSKEQEGQATDSDPALAATAIFKLAALPEPPLRLLLSDSLFDMVIEATENKITDWKKEESLSRASEKLIPMPKGYLDDTEL
ncbi:MULTISPECIES: SDR family NAD(P)-dependent oxidoreductase [Bacteria]|uniref:SDR family NAD(P)-dependent oxidoreductase n=1 Tax=Bacteria TaxID=2 RepID=UPI0010F7BD58|nr:MULTISPECIES: SDR family NAD(P)-dependent oxidoreductase [Bacteria]MBM7710884.1 NAD(P)-dependent dehydrogenase (short-subunit alcohol dehydrogenase family) [Enterococcus xiangfangensis]NBK07914.1 SDR family NAD(P)-dependent oxidoreductase [Enterococcus asini]